MYLDTVVKTILIIISLFSPVGFRRATAGSLRECEVGWALIVGGIYHMGQRIVVGRNYSLLNPLPRPTTNKDISG
jgi:predicted phage tail protein